MAHPTQSGNIEANRDIYADILNTGVIQQKTINLIIADQHHLIELLKQPEIRIRTAPDRQTVVQTGRERVTLPAGWQKAQQLLAHDDRTRPDARHRAYALWLVTREPVNPPQLVAARDHFIPLSGWSEEGLLRPQFSERRFVGEGPQRQVERVHLDDVTEAVSKYAAFVLLGPPGCGKSTVLHRLALDMARAFLTGHSHRLPLLINLAEYDWQQMPQPLDFVVRHWQARVADDFVTLARSGHILLLADGLNEMLRLDSSGQQRRRANAWERFINEYFAEAGNPLSSRAIIASRDQSDYDQPLGLPRVEIEPLNDEQVLAFLGAYLRDEAENAWQAIKKLKLLEQARIPYPLFILTQLYDPQTGDLPPNRGRLFARYAEYLLEGERQAGHDWYEPEAALAALARLGYELQRQGESTVVPGAALKAFLPQQVQLPDRREPVDTPPEAVFGLACRARLLIADPNSRGETYKFSHQLLQEQFAARHLLTRWQNGQDLGDLWRTSRSRSEMPPADVEEWDPLPPPPPTRWEQATILAAGITPRPDHFVQAVLAANPALAGRTVDEGAAPVNHETRTAVQQALLADLSHPDLHRRTRIQAGRVLAAVGDSRFEPVTISGVAVILPHLVKVPGGQATLGSRRWPLDRQAYSDERPQHRVNLAPFYLARYPVTNAEYGCFIRAGGYDTERYWTPTGRQWRHGELEESGPIQEILEIRQYYLQNPEEIERGLKQERMTPDTADTWRALIQRSEEEVRRQFSTTYAPRPHHRPHYWEDPAYNAANQPVVGVTWYEAMAYAAWLNEVLVGANGHLPLHGAAPGGGRESHLSLPLGEDRELRLPSEAEWEWAAGGPRHGRYPWGRRFDEDKANTLEGRVLNTTPVGAYPAGAAACGALDLSGNVYEWTHTLSREYPYRPDDGREDPEAEGRRVVRGGSWYVGRRNARVSYRSHPHPDLFSDNNCFRVVDAPVFSF